MLLLLACLLLPVAFAGNVGSPSQASDDDRVYLLSVPSLTFIENQLTNSRRGQPHQQLVCIAGDAKDDVDRHPVRVDCYNIGVDDSTDRANPQPKWHCVTSLHRGVKISSWTVRCEGYSYPGDAYVFRGSCWLEYELDYEKVAPDGRPSDPESGYVNDGYFAGFWDFLTVVRNLLLVLAAGFIIIKVVAPQVLSRLNPPESTEESTAPLARADRAGYAAVGSVES